MIAVTYIFWRFFYRIGEFLRHWYIKSVRMYYDFVLDVLERLDRYFAWKITLRFLFHPLYGDYSIIGRVLGFFFRIFRLLVASVAYIFVFIIAIIIYFLWIIIPPYIIFKSFTFFNI